MSILSAPHRGTVLLLLCTAATVTSAMAEPTAARLAELEAMNATLLAEDQKRSRRFLSRGLQETGQRQVDCPQGYYDTTRGRSWFWLCGEGCIGGPFTDADCECACQPVCDDCGNDNGNGNGHGGTTGFTMPTTARPTTTRRQWTTRPPATTRFWTTQPVVFPSGLMDRTTTVPVIRVRQGGGGGGAGQAEEDEGPLSMEATVGITLAVAVCCVGAMVGSVAFCFADYNKISKVLPEISVEQQAKPSNSPQGSPRPSLRSTGNPALDGTGQFAVGTIADSVRSSRVSNVSGGRKSQTSRPSHHSQGSTYAGTHTPSYMQEQMSHVESDVGRSLSKNSSTTRSHRSSRHGRDSSPGNHEGHHHHHHHHGDHHLGLHHGDHHLGDSQRLALSHTQSEGRASVRSASEGAPRSRPSHHSGTEEHRRSHSHRPSGHSHQGNTSYYV